MEEIFGRPFLKIRPLWLVNGRDNRMEFDGYCEALQLAFEHHGEQHFGHVAHFQDSIEALHLRQEDDACKRALCAANLL